MYTVEKINIGKLYLLVLLGVLSYVLLMILVISIITIIFPKFNNVGLVFVITALVSGNYIYKFSFSKSSNKTRIKLNDKKIVIEESEILLDNIKYVKFKGTIFNYYPKIIIELTNAKKISLRISKNNDFEKLISGLKANAKISNVFSY